MNVQAVFFSLPVCRVLRAKFRRTSTLLSEGIVGFTPLRPVTWESMDRDGIAGYNNEQRLKGLQEMILYENVKADTSLIFDTQLGAILNAVADGIIAVDGQSNVQFMNAAAERITGWSAAEALYAPLSAILPIHDVLHDIELEDLAACAIADAHPVAIPRGLHGFSRMNRLYAIEGEFVPTFLDSIGSGCVVTFRDAGARIREEAEEREAVCELVPLTFADSPDL